MGIISVPRETLSTSQNEAMTKFVASINAQFRYTKAVKFATVNNQLKYTDKMYKDNPDYQGIANTTRDKKSQQFLANTLINLKINNDKVTANGSVKLAYLASYWSESSNPYQKAVANAFARIDAAVGLSFDEKNGLKLSSSASFSAMLSQVLTSQSSDTASWIKSRLNLNANTSTNNLHGSRSNFNVSALLSLSQTIKGENNSSAQAAMSVAMGLTAALGASNVSGSTASIMSSISAGFSFAKTFTGTTTKEIDSKYQKSMSEVKIDASATAALDTNLTALVSANSISRSEASSLKSAVTNEFFSAFGTKVSFNCSGKVTL